MPKKKLQAAIARNGGAVANVVTKHEKLSEEELRVAAFNARDNQNASITDKMANDNRRNTLLSEMGFDWFDIEDIKPNPNNAYKITEEDVKNLAGLIYNRATHSARNRRRCSNRRRRKTLARLQASGRKVWRCMAYGSRPLP